MKRQDKLDNIKLKIDEILDEYYLDVQCGGTGVLSSQEIIIKLVSKAVISLCTAWWSITELTEYIRERKNFKESVRGQ